MGVVHAPRRVGIFRPWPARLSEGDVFLAARKRVKTSGIPTWVHVHTEDQECGVDPGACISVPVSGVEGTYEDLVGSPGAFKV